MDSSVIELLKWLIPVIIAGASSFFGIKYGLKNLAEKVEDNRKSVSDKLDEIKKTITEKIDKLDIKIEKMSEQQIKTDKELALVEHRVKKMEENQDEAEETMKEILSQFEKLKIKLSFLKIKGIDTEEQD